MNESRSSSAWSRWAAKFSMSRSFVPRLYSSFQMGSYMRAASNFPTFIRPSHILIPMSMVRSRATHSKRSAEKAARRIRSGLERSDFFSYMLKNNGNQSGKEEMTEDEMKEAASILIIAGSETPSLPAFSRVMRIHSLTHSPFQSHFSFSFALELTSI